MGKKMQLKRGLEEFLLCEEVYMDDLDYLLKMTKLKKGWVMGYPQLDLLVANWPILQMPSDRFLVQEEEEKPMVSLSSNSIIRIDKQPCHQPGKNMKNYFNASIPMIVLQ